MHAAIDRLGLSGSTGFEWVRGSMGAILRTVTEVNKTLQDGDWDADPAKEREVRSLIQAFFGRFSAIKTKSSWQNLEFF